jgi:hypothetical protein
LSWLFNIEGALIDDYESLDSKGLHRPQGEVLKQKSLIKDQLGQFFFID